MEQSKGEIFLKSVNFYGGEISFQKASNLLNQFYEQIEHERIPENPIQTPTTEHLDTAYNTAIDHAIEILNQYSVITNSHQYVIDRISRLKK